MVELFPFYMLSKDNADMIIKPVYPIRLHGDQITATSWPFLNQFLASEPSLLAYI